ncbi:MAG: GNAT family N-acetyltransferase [Chitinophagaceae bacterium]|nr:GNAT family N-acetyltransferase [Chitinophagaceae bacterium]
MDEIIIIEYTDEYAEHFRLLNLEWLEQYGLLESHDLMVINDPRGTILDRGGYIFLAKVNDTIAGSAALMNEGHGTYELAKMAVTSAFRGRGISKLLIESCIEKAKEAGAKKISLFSNHQLQTAIHLYEKYGFKHVEVKDSPFETADVKMELDLTPCPSSPKEPLWTKERGEKQVSEK